MGYSISTQPKFKIPIVTISYFDEISLCYTHPRDI